MTTTEQRPAPSAPERPPRSVPRVNFTDAEAGAKDFPDSGASARRYNYYVPGQAQADALRGRHRRGAAGSAALPVAGLDLRLRRRADRLPADLDQAQGLGCRRARAGPRCRDRRRRPGPDVAGARLARVPRPQRGVGTDDLPEQREHRPAAQPEHRERAEREVVRTVDPQLDHLRRAQRRGVDARRARPGPLRLRRQRTVLPDEHAQHRAGGEQRAQDPVRPGPGALQPHPQRGDRELRRNRPRRRLEQRSRVAGGPRDRRGADRDRGRLGRGHVRHERHLRATDR